MQTLKKKKDLLRLKISRKVSGRRSPRNQRNREDSTNWIRQLLEPVYSSCKDQDWKRLYEPSSLRGILASVEHHLSRFSYGKTIFKDSDFKKTRDALKAKQKQLKRHGLGNRPKATTALTDDEIEILSDKKLFGLSSPQALLNTAWLNNMILGCKEKKNCAEETSF